MEHSQESRCQSLEAHELQKSVQDVASTVNSVTGGGGDEAWEKTWYQDEQGAPRGGNCVGAKAPDSMKEDEAHPSGGRGSDVEKPTQWEWKESAREEPKGEEFAQERAMAYDPLDMDGRVCFPIQYFELEDLENIFLRINYPELLIGEELAVDLSSTETQGREVNLKTYALPRKPS